MVDINPAYNYENMNNTIFSLPRQHGRTALQLILTTVQELTKIIHLQRINTTLRIPPPGHQRYQIVYTDVAHFILEYNRLSFGERSRLIEDIYSDSEFVDTMPQRIIINFLVHASYQELILLLHGSQNVSSFSSLSSFINASMIESKPVLPPPPPPEIKDEINKCKMCLRTTVPVDKDTQLCEFCTVISETEAVILPSLLIKLPDFLKERFAFFVNTIKDFIIQNHLQTTYGMGRITYRGPIVRLRLLGTSIIDDPGIGSYGKILTIKLQPFWLDMHEYSKSLIEMDRIDVSAEPIFRSTFPEETIKLRVVINSTEFQDYDKFDLTILEQIGLQKLVVERLLDPFNEVFTFTSSLFMELVFKIEKMVDAISSPSYLLSFNKGVTVKTKKMLNRVAWYSENPQTETHENTLMVYFTSYKEGSLGTKLSIPDKRREEALLSVQHITVLCEELFKASVQRHIDLIDEQKIDEELKKFNYRNDWSREKTKKLLIKRNSILTNLMDD